MDYGTVRIEEKIACISRTGVAIKCIRADSGDSRGPFGPRVTHLPPGPAVSKIAPKTISQNVRPKVHKSSGPGA